MSPLFRKLLRDLWRMKGQAAAIALVMAIGVAVQVMMSGLYLSLSTTRDAYYERYRLADVFAPATRAPEVLASTLADIPGVARVQTRVTGAGLVNLPHVTLPVAARAISLPDSGSPQLNAVLITEGQMFNPAHPAEILLLEAFAEAHRIAIGDTINVTLRGVARDLRVVGYAQSPEFIYSAAPGEFMPDDARFAVIWMSRDALGAAFDMRGAFNEVLLGLSREARQPEVLAAVDTILKPYGGIGAYGLEDQLSNRFVHEEISGLQSSGAAVPPFFLAIAAFLLYIVISRMVQSEREEIGLMKAFGYTNIEVGLHYLEMVLTIALVGAAFGCVIGIAGGYALIPVYTTYYKFPFLLFRVDPASFVTGVSTSIAVASVGGLFVLRRIFRLAPAEAMRPPAPADYSRSGKFGMAVTRWLDQPSRMVWRRITRQPVRMAGATIGIAAGMALTFGMMVIYDGFEVALDRSFTVLDRSDATVAFAGPASAEAALDLRRIPGVTVVEPQRQVSVIFHNGLLTHKGGITGLAPDARLLRALDAQGQAIDLPKRGIVLSTALANILQVGTGDSILIEVREGRQPTLAVPVAGIADSLMGSPAYMDLSALNRLLGEPERITGAYLALDSAQTQIVYEKLRDMPAIAGVSLKADAMRAFADIMNQGAGSARYVMSVMAFIITFGIVYNAARVAQAERARDLASLRVMGFHTGETAFVLLGELAVVTLAALPLGIWAGKAISAGIAAGFSTDLYQIPVIDSPRAMGVSIIAVVGAALVSGWLVKRDIDRADIVSALKTRE